jgi:thiamine-phosphate pyrophosphorylase
LPEPAVVRPQFCLALEAGPAAADRLAAALAAVDIASVFIKAGDGGARDVQPLVMMAQKSGAAALIMDDARLARTLKAEGVLLLAGADAFARYEETRSIVGKGAIVGVTCGLSRHEAMEIGEAGADFLAFGPDGGGEDALERQADHVGWWAEIFEVPCVALGADEARMAMTLARAGADFVCVTARNGETTDALVSRLQSVVQMLEPEAAS